jgi:hypothetical protein
MSRPSKKQGGDEDQPNPCPDLSAIPGHDQIEPDGLTSQQHAAIEAMLHEPTLFRAAAVAGVSERTLRRWLQEPVFRGAMFLARREAFGQAIGLTQRYAPVAVATLVKVMNDAHSSASAKVTAAGVLLKFGREGIELDDLAERVEALERSRVTVKQLGQNEASKQMESSE